MASFDVLVRGGEVIDGGGGPRYRADVGIRRDRIEAVDDLSGAAAATELDARGLIVGPGFVDVHNHSDGWLLCEPNFSPKTLQGFTAEVLMADGISYAPVDETNWRAWFFYLRALNGLRLDQYDGWQSLGDFAARLDRRTAQNTMFHVPYANVRALACGFGRAAPDDFQRQQMHRTIREGMELGAVGLSTGLDYICQNLAGTEELVGACRVVAAAGGLYVSHIRYKLGLIEALREAIEIGRRSGVRVHISHLKAGSPEQAEAVFALLDRAGRDVDLSFDVYPYQYGSTMLNYLLPYEVWQQGPLAAIKRLDDPAIRRRFAEGLAAYPLSLDQIHLAWLPGSENRSWLGQTLQQYVDAHHGSAEDVLCDLLIEERLAVLCVLRDGDDSLVEPFLADRRYMMGSDGIFFPEGAIHPRIYGSAGRLLGPCVRERKLFSLEEAVEKLSSRPAARFGLDRRGRLQPGWFADLVVFDPLRIGDAATYEQPHRPTGGVWHLLVNGQFVVRDAEPIRDFDGSPPGRFLASSHAAPYPS